jgi:hypothetical protein
MRIFGLLIYLSPLICSSQILFAPNGIQNIQNSNNNNFGFDFQNPPEKLSINGSIRGDQSGAVRINTGNGYLDLGPKNSSYANIETDRAAFYFNKPVKIAGNNIDAVPSTFQIKVQSNNVVTFSNDLSTQLFGNLNLPINSNVFIGNSINQGDPRLRFHHNGTHGYIDFNDNLHFRNDVNWSSPLTIYGNGTVGVGFSTTYNAGDYRNSGFKFAVNGDIICEGIKVIVDVPDADYVFDQNYFLIPLKELESFLISNKHLPNIPSAQEFKECGYNIGDMDEMLLRKIEELTLYIIEQNKKIIELEKRLN